MTELPVRVENRIAEYVGEEKLLCYNSGYSLQFTFDEEWDKYRYKTLLLWYMRADGVACVHQILFADDECPLPIIPDALKLCFGVYTDDLRTSTDAEIPVLRTIKNACCMVHPEPSEDIYDQIVEMLNLLNVAQGEEINNNVEKYFELHPLVSEIQGEDKAGYVMAVNEEGRVVPVEAREVTDEELDVIIDEIGGL